MTSEMGHRRDTTDGGSEAGFTIVEVVVAITLLTGSLLALANVMFGGMAALGALQQRSEMTQKATAELELLRSTPYDTVCVNASDQALYPTGKYQGLDAVAVTGSTCPAAVTDRPADGEAVAHTVTRWVTWTDAAGGDAHKFKRLTVLVAWQENGKATRSVTLTSLLYPGGLGTSAAGGAAANSAPTAVVTSPTTGAVAGTTSISFVGGASSDPDAGDTLVYEWTFGDATAPVTGSSTIGHVYAASGTYTAQLKVTDGSGAFGVATLNVIVAASGSTNTAPSAVATAVGPLDGTAPYPVTIDGVGSSDPQGDALTYTWSWGDGSAATTGVQGTHTFATGGTYTITLTVTDTGGLSGTANVSATIITPLNCDLLSGSFRNPASDAVANDVQVSRNNAKPDSLSFAFVATTNAACESVAAVLPYDRGPLVVELLRGTTTGGVTSWSGTKSVGSEDRFSTGGSQTYGFWTPSATGASEKLSVTFSVHP